MSKYKRYTFLALFGVILFAVIFMIQQRMYNSNVDIYLKSQTLFQKSIYKVLLLKHDDISFDIEHILEIEHKISGAKYFTFDRRFERLSDVEELSKISSEEIEKINKNLQKSLDFSYALNFNSKWYVASFIQCPEHFNIYIVSLLRSQALENIYVNRLKQLGVLFIILSILLYMLNRLLLHTQKLNSEKDKISLALKESNLYFDNAMIGFLIIDKNKKIVKVNDFLCEEFGFTKDELLGKTTDILHVSEESYAKWCALISTKLEKGSVKYVRYEMKKKNGDTIYVEASGVPFDKEKNFLEGSTVWTMKDITKQVENENIIKEQELYLQQRVMEEVKKNIEHAKAYEEEKMRDVKFSAIGKLSAGITHEINTPLTYVKGNLEMMKLDMENISDEQLKHQLIDDCASLQDGINRIATIIESMREMAQQTNETKEPVNIYETIITALILAYNRSKHICKIYINTKEFNLDLDKNEFECTCMLQKQRIEQVWVIIINNALDELQKIEDFDQRRLEIECSAQEKYVVVTFKDNAGGIEESILTDIFEPFVSTKTHAGMGVGLSISKKILQEQNGTIEAYNENGGAVFEVKLLKSAI